MDSGQNGDKLELASDLAMAVNILYVLSALPVGLMVRNRAEALKKIHQVCLSLNPCVTPHMHTHTLSLSLSLITEIHECVIRVIGDCRVGQQG